MPTALCPEMPQRGFSFDNCKRNAVLENKGMVCPKAVKTGTTIVGIIYKDGVVLGADTRATEGDIVADKNCQKIHFLANNIYCCGAGTAADTEMTTRLVASQLELHRLNMNREPRVCTANQMLKQYLFRYQGYISAALVVGGVDVEGPHLYLVYPHGSTDKLPYGTMGSGSLAAIGVFEAGWKPDLNEDEAVELVRKAIAAGIFNDLGSGSNVDICVIRRGSVDYKRNDQVLNVKGDKGSHKYPKGTTKVLSSSIVLVGEETMDIDLEQMDTA